MNTQHYGNPEPWSPTSGQLLRELVTAFRLDEASVGGERAGRTLDRADHLAKRYFAGDWVGPKQRRVLCKAVVEALLTSGILAQPEMPTEEGDGNADLTESLTEALGAWVASWDREFQATAQMYPGADRALAAFVLARPIVIDAALRWSSALVLLGASAPSGKPPWVDRRGGALLLRAVLNEHWPGRTNDEYFVAFGVNERTFDRWISPSVDPEIPRVEDVKKIDNIKRIAEVLSTKSGEPAEAIRTRLRREYGLFALLRSVARVTGWPLAVHLATALVRMVADARACASEGPLTEAARHRFALSLLHGSHLPVNAVVVDKLLERGKDTPWADDLRAVRDGRVRERLERCFRALMSVPQGVAPKVPGLGELDNETRRMLLEKVVVEAWLRDDAIARTAQPKSVAELASSTGLAVDVRKLAVGGLIWRAEAAKARGDSADAARAWLKVVELEPEDATHRFLCGALLWQAGNFDQAEVELRESCRLAPDWDRPFVELAILWLNSGQLERALAHLRSGADQFRERSDHFNYNEGLLLWQLGRLDDAFASLERAVELNPHHALALDRAAHCAFLLFDKVKGWHYARRALHLGRDESWRQHCS